MRQIAAPDRECKCSPRRDICPSGVEITADLWFAAGMSSAHALRIIREIVRNIFAQERLAEETPPPSTPAPRRTSLARILFAPEPLPLDPETPRPPRAPAAETLGEEPEAERAPGRGRWLRWLFRPESLEPHP
jgi:hypothetical protein